MLELEDIFGHGGPLQRALPAFNLRRQQLHMAERVAGAIAQRETLVVEAGTGTGKTFAYLVPALLSGARVLISTGTRTLQDQLYAKDLPLLAAALGRPAKVALLKGRANYLCRHRLAQGPGETLELPGLAPAASSGSLEPMLERIRRFALGTRTGDLAEVAGLADTDPLWGQITSSRDNCLGARCPEFSRCHVALARRRALEADIVIVNHHLLLADLALKEDGFGDLLGAADAVILDEAHQIPDLAAQFFGASVSSRRIETLLGGLQAELAAARRARAGGDAAEDGRIARIGAAAEAVRASVGRLAAQLRGRSGRFAWDEADPRLGDRVSGLSRSLATLTEELGGLEEDSALGAFGARARELGASLERIDRVEELDGARSVEVTPRGFALSLMPFDIAARFRALMDTHGCSWVFTSATLSLGEDFSPFTTRLGLEGCATVKIDSPFDYPRQGLLFLPVGMPMPSSPGYLAAVMEVAGELIEAARGGAFVLFTSHRALTQAAAAWRARGQTAGSHRLLVQGEAPRERLLRAFREDGDAVLLGTTSFWEGVDVKGRALRLVIIEKLPFASPDDPLVRARIEHLQGTGVNAFRDFQLPQAALALKQGVGRLIRSEQDFGAVAICDPRLTERAYGRVFLAALPPMSVTRERGRAVAFLREHAGGAPEARPASALESTP